MTAMQNLSQEEWADELVRGVRPKEMAHQLRAGEYLPWVDTLVRFTDDHDEILELGSGAGQNAAVLGLHRRRMTLLDWSGESLHFSRRLFDVLGLTGRFVQHDLTRPLPFANDSFDAAFCCSVLQYFSDEQITQILKETARIVRKRVILLIPNARSIAYRLGKWNMERHGRWHWGRERPLATLRPHCRRAGIAIRTEFSLATKHSLEFLTMRGGRLAKKALTRALQLKDHPRPAALRQGYMLVAVADKSPEGAAVSRIMAVLA